MTNNQTLAQALLAGNFERKGSDTHALTDPIVDTYMVVTLDQLKPYDYNPRLTKNPRYDEIKASIRERGLDSSPPITRRPGDAHYIIRNGGNTRLSILNELWQEMRDEKFFRIGCMFRPWSGEIVALTGHLAENELHGELTFIEKALGIQTVRDLLSKGSGKEVSQKELSQNLSKNGFPISQSAISRMNDTITFLLPAIPNALYGGLSTRHIIKLLSLKNATLRTWLKYAGSTSSSPSEEAIEAFQDILTLFDHSPDNFEFNRIKDEITGHLADRFQTAYDLMALEISEDESRQIALKTPPVTGSQNIGTIPLTPDQHLQQTSVSHNESEPLETPPNAVQKRATPKVKTTTDDPIDAKPHFIGLNRDDEESNTQAQSENRVQAIQNLVQHLEHNPLEPNLYCVPASADGIYPITDIFTINPTQDTPEWIKTNIVQLAREIADEYGLSKYIEEADSFLGYQCQHTGTVSLGYCLLSFLNALHTIAAGDSHINPHLIQALLIGQASTDKEQRLSDTSLIKVYRLIRLGRRLVELENGDHIQMS